MRWSDIFPDSSMVAGFGGDFSTLKTTQVGGGRKVSTVLDERPGAGYYETLVLDSGYNQLEANRTKDKYSALAFHADMVAKYK